MRRRGVRRRESEEDRSEEESEEERRAEVRSEEERREVEICHFFLFILFFFCVSVLSTENKTRSHTQRKTHVPPPLTAFYVSIVSGR